MQLLLGLGDRSDLGRGMPSPETTTDPSPTSSDSTPSGRSGRFAVIRSTYSARLIRASRVLLGLRVEGKEDEMHNRILLAASIGLYAACLPLGSFCVNGECAAWPSWGVLFFAPLGLVSGRAESWIWLANPILFAAWYAIFVRRRLPALVLSTVAQLIGASFLLVTDVVTNEAGLPFPVTGYGAGYWLWLASMFSACVAALMSRRERAELAWSSR